MNLPELPNTFSLLGGMIGGYLGASGKLREIIARLVRLERRVFGLSVLKKDDA